MSRKQRIKSETNIYHIVLRGINRQVIFEDDQDFEYFLKVLERVKEKSQYSLYAYCLMDNHIHILLKENIEPLSTIFKRIGSTYVYWYNKKYGRVGNLFQGRYKSEAVEDQGYFLTVLRYIHQNPLKAGIVSNLANYTWSSYNEYLNKEWICDTKFALNIFSENTNEARILFKRFHDKITKDICLEGDIDKTDKLSDIEGIEFIKSKFNIKNPQDLQILEKEKRNNLLAICKANGMSIRQLSRITGVSVGVIRNVKKGDD